MAFSGLELKLIKTHYGQHCSGLHVIILPIFLSCPFPALSVTQFPSEIQAPEICLGSFISK